MREEYASLSLVMSTRLDTCMEALRFLARSSELQANRLLTAELRIRDFLTPVGTNRAAQRAALEELDNAVSREAELRPREASFWQEISDFIARRLATLNFDWACQGLSWATVSGRFGGYLRSAPCKLCENQLMCNDFASSRRSYEIVVDRIVSENWSDL